MSKIGRRLLLTQTLIVHMIRTAKVPFVQSRPSKPLLAATIAVMAAGIFLPMGPIPHYFKTQPLPLAFFPIVAVILVGYMVLTQAMKGFYTRRYSWQ